MIWSALIALAVVAVYVWQDGIHACQDGARYTSSTRQPSPFHRRFCHWPPRLLMVVTWASFVLLASLLGGWKASLLFITLPGVWFCSIHPTTVDAPAMLFSWLSALAWQHGQPYLAVGLSCLGGTVHERSPVFAALYAFHWLPLVGLAVPLLVGLRAPGKPNRESTDLADHLVGHSGLDAVIAHKPHVDLLGLGGLVLALRGLPVLAAYVGAGAWAFLGLGVAFASRLIGTDTVRFLLWAAPPLCVAAKDAPAWMVVVQALTFQRAMR